MYEAFAYHAALYRNSMILNEFEGRFMALKILKMESKMRGLLQALLTNLETSFTLRPVPDTDAVCENAQQFQHVRQQQSVALGWLNSNCKLTSPLIPAAEEFCDAFS